MHVGHYNAIRQAKNLYPDSTLVCGIVTDEEMHLHKRPPFFTNDERRPMIENCKWVDEVAWNVPYAPSHKFLKELDCDIVAHGDDIIVNALTGENAYVDIPPKKFKIFKRTPGVSTTDLISRLDARYIESLSASRSRSGSKSKRSIKPAKSSNKEEGDFLCSSSLLAAFSNRRFPSEQDNVVYVFGSFDCFHEGDIDFLRRAKAVGTFLYVGILADEDCPTIPGYPGTAGNPCMPLHERALCVLACKYVDEVIIKCPTTVSDHLLDVLRINTVGHQHDKENSDAIFKAARVRGILVGLGPPDPNLMSLSRLYDRIAERHAAN